MADKVAELRSAVEALRVLAGTAAGRSMLAGAAGITFNGMRNMYEVLGYPDKITVDMYRDMYERGGIAKRVVEAFPKATWRGGGELIEDEDPEVFTPFEEQWWMLDQRLNIWSAFQAADILAGVGEYSVILIGGPGSFESPLGRLTIDTIPYVTPYGQIDAVIDEKDIIVKPEDPRFGHPEFYKFPKRLGTNDQKVHWTRIIHVADGRLDDPLHGPPRLKCIWNYLLDLLKVGGGGAEAYFQRANPETQFDLDKEIDLSEPEQEKMREEVELLMHKAQKYIRTRGITMKKFGAEVANFANPSDAIITLIAGTTEIPKRILTGSEMGELASTQDRSNWNDRVKARRTEFAEPYVVRQFVDRLILQGALPQPADGYEVQWPTLQNLEETEKAEIAERWASANQKNGDPVVTANEIRVVLGLAPIEESVDEEELARIRGEGEEDPGEEDTDVVEEVDDEEEELPRAAAAHVDQAPADASWRGVHRAADSNAKAVKDLLTRAFTKVTTALDLEAITSAVAARNDAAVMEYSTVAVAEMETYLKDRLPRRIQATLVAGGSATASSLTVATTLRTAASKPKTKIAFDKADKEAIKWAAEHADELIEDIAMSSRAAVRKIMAEGYKTGMPPRAMAKRIQQVITLTEKQAENTISLYEKILNANPGTTIRAGKTVVRIPVKGNRIAIAEKAVANYTERALKERAMTITRTVTIRAANEGQLRLWAQAVRRGELTGLEEKEWIDTGDGRTCVSCQSMGGRTVPVNASFDSPMGPIDSPPLHPRCRCAMGITEVKRSRAVA